MFYLFYFLQKNSSGTRFSSKGALQEKHTFYYSSNNPFFEGRRKRSSSRSEGCGPSKKGLEELLWRHILRNVFLGLFFKERLRQKNFLRHVF